MYADRGYDCPHILAEFPTEVTYRRYFTNLYTKTDKTSNADVALHLDQLLQSQRDDGYKTSLVNFSECVSTKNGLEQYLLIKEKLIGRRIVKYAFVRVRISRTWSIRYCHL